MPRFTRSWLSAIPISCEVRILSRWLSVIDSGEVMSIPSKSWHSRNKCVQTYLGMIAWTLKRNSKEKCKMHDDEYGVPMWFNLSFNFEFKFNFNESYLSSEEKGIFDIHFYEIFLLRTLLNLFPRARYYY